MYSFCFIILCYKRWSAYQMQKDCLKARAKCEERIRWKYEAWMELRCQMNLQQTQSHNLCKRIHFHLFKDNSIYFVPHFHQKDFHDGNKMKEMAGFVDSVKLIPCNYKPEANSNFKAWYFNELLRYKFDCMKILKEDSYGS